MGVLRLIFSVFLETFPRFLMTCFCCNIFPPMPIITLYRVFDKAQRLESVRDDVAIGNADNMESSPLKSNNGHILAIV